jgi:hypothetical protein
MCGSLKTTSVDHYLPQSSHPDWALFSLNLVPACDCNTLRQNAISTTNPPARILHPYFDAVLNTRLLSWTFTMNPNRSIRIVSIIAGNINVDYHLANIVIKTNLLEWLEKTWGKLLDKPSNVILTLSNSNRITQNDLVTSINDLLSRYDQSFGTPNNWNSIFFHGLLNLGAGDLTLILNTHNNGLV